jgi:hypothetical protein
MPAMLLCCTADAAGVLVVTFSKLVGRPQQPHVRLISTSPQALAVRGAQHRVTATDVSAPSSCKRSGTRGTTTLLSS